MTDKFDEHPRFTNPTNASMFEFAYPPQQIFQADAQWTYGREPILRRMPDGSWVCLIYSGGKREPSRENCVLITRSHDNGKTWSKPEQLFAHGQRCVWATELFTETEYPTIFVQTFIYDTHYLEIQTFYSTTTDNGKTWSSPRSPQGTCGNVSVRKGITLADGTKLLPVYWTEMRDGFNWDQNMDQAAETNSPACFCGDVKCRFCSGVWLSHDNGKTWSQHGYINLPDSCDSGAWEPNVVQLSNGNLAMLVRADGTGCLWRSDSKDNGITWSKPYPTDIPNPNSKFDILTIENQIVILHNPIVKVRTPLSLWVSRDDMQTWHKTIDLIKGPQEKWICYPHAQPDDQARLLYIASDAVKEFYLQTVPYADFLD